MKKISRIVAVFLVLFLLNNELGAQVYGAVTFLQESVFTNENEDVSTVLSEDKVEDNLDSTDESEIKSLDDGEDSILPNTPLDSQEVEAESGLSPKPDGNILIEESASETNNGSHEVVPDKELDEVEGAALSDLSEDNVTSFNSLNGIGTVADLEGVLQAIVQVYDSGMAQSNPPVVELTPEFAADMLINGVASATVAVPAGVNIVVDGSQLVGQPLVVSANQRHFNINNTGDGTLTLTNITLQSTGANAGGINLANGLFVVHNMVFDSLTNSAITGARNVTVENSIFENLTKSAISNVANLTIRESLFKDNVAGNGAAILLPGNSTTIITDSEFVNNRGTAPGYSGGAIAAEQTNDNAINLEVSKSYFYGNVAPSATVAGGGGGAISIYHGAGNLIVDQCVFEENKTLVVGSNSTGDGAAIAIRNNSQIDNQFTLKYSIMNSSFVRNQSADDAGAILIEGAIKYANPIQVKGDITNCTFYENSGATNSGYGGAIQVCGRASVELYFNTFYGNTKGSNGGRDGMGGGAIGTSMSGTLAIGTINAYNNIFAGNVSGSANRNQSVSGGTNKGGNVGWDSAALPAGFSVLGVYGSEAPQLSNNGVANEVGRSGSGRMLQTVYIAPRLANGTALYAYGYGTANVPGAVNSYKDQRFYPRGNVKDSGSVDITWTKFEANSGEWETTPTTEYSYNNPMLFVNLNGSQKPSAVFGSAAIEVYSVADVGGTVGVIPVDPTRKDYIFRGWTTVKDDEDTLVSSGNILVQPASEQTFYALWSSQTYTVTYVKNDGSSQQYIDSTEYQKNDTVEVASITDVSGDGSEDWSRLGYTFAGWLSDEETAVTYQGGESFVMLEENVTLTAQWTQNPTYTVTYMKNDSTDTSYTEATSYEQNGIVTVADISNVAADGSQDWSREGYTFVGWLSDEATPVTYQGGETFAMPGKNITLTAQWTKNPTYTVTYIKNDGTVDEYADSSVYEKNATVMVANVTDVSGDGSQDWSRLGYIFTGWLSNEGTPVTYQIGESFPMPDKNITLTAQWTQETNPAPTYLVTYIKNDGSTEEYTDSSQYEENAKVLVADIKNISSDESKDWTRLGYTFVGWLSNEGTPVLYQGSESFAMPGNNITLTAQWSKNLNPTYTVTYAKNDGTNTIYTDPADYLSNSVVKPLKKLAEVGNWKRHGYTFGGWSTKADSSTAISSCTISDRNVTLYAIWIKSPVAPPVTPPTAPPSRYSSGSGRPNTGDNSTIVSYILLGIAALGGTGILIARKRRKK